MIVTIHSVFCDGADCNAWIAQEKTRLAARHLASDFGWLRVRGPFGALLDLCPECVTARGPVTTCNAVTQDPPE